jgi:hypothetical protein
VECRQGSLRLGAWLPPHIHASTGSTVSADMVGCSSVGVEEETQRDGEWPRIL